MVQSAWSARDGVGGDLGDQRRHAALAHIPCVRVSEVVESTADQLR
jgi:hypothetical protein